MNETFTGLGTQVIKLPTTGTWNIDGKITLPNLIEGAGANSAVVVTINLNGGGTLYTGGAGAEGFHLSGQGTAGDSLNIILTSSAAIDQPLNAIKTTVALY